MVELNQRAGRDPSNTRELTIKRLTQTTALAPSIGLEKHFLLCQYAHSHLHLDEEKEKHCTWIGQCVNSATLGGPEAVLQSSPVQQKGDAGLWLKPSETEAPFLSDPLWSLHIHHSSWHLSNPKQYLRSKKKTRQAELQGCRRKFGISCFQ